jgi:hypothetical protein
MEIIKIETRLSNEKDVRNGTVSRVGELLYDAKLFDGPIHLVGKCETHRDAIIAAVDCLLMPEMAW